MESLVDVEPVVAVVQGILFGIVVVGTRGRRRGRLCGAIEVNCDRSSTLNTNSAFGCPIDMLVPPVPLIPASYANIGQLL
ncbi:hypothetical protein AWB69_07227 [Caballeronia udeis]|uniref:Uncharacterized protein n=1 Tax=Caballeronia udeis TaxID=1232866 RepID=A0A158J5X3_9BURK|nr:hypothetical protein AWB69_07227 [Caballeronia udeis]